MRFDWDPKKARQNLLKHHISFELAITVFDDPFGRVLEDAKHSTSHEKREWIIGQSDTQILVVVFTIRYPGPVYRLISARKANRQERRLYEEYKRI